MLRGTAHILAVLVFRSCISKISLYSVVRVANKDDNSANSSIVVQEAFDSNT